MGVTKKATIVAKQETKKRGRPAGSRNTKTLEKMKVGETLSFDELNRLNSSISSEGWIPPATDWELLAKRLQKALATEMKTVEGMEKLFEELKSVSKKVSELTFWQRLKLVITGKY
jgi:uncharacterized coiled-coil DUF342 family protein